jgi:hypothetical protein
LESSWALSDGTISFSIQPIFNSIINELNEEPVW